MSNQFQALSKKISGDLFSSENIIGLFGHEAAEDESPERLLQYFWKNELFLEVTADVKLKILVGHKGTGKSALFNVALHDDKKNNTLSILIKPTDVENIDLTQNDFFLLVKNWTLGLRSIIVSKAITFFAGNILDTVPVEGVGKNFLTFISTFCSTKSKAHNIDQTTYDSFMRNQRINVYIDDMDRGWRGSNQQISSMSALINAARDISNENPSIHFKIALRTDAYSLLRKADESTDKFEGSVVMISWTNSEIIMMLAKRVQTFFNKKIQEEELLGKSQLELTKYFSRVIAPTFNGKGSWANTPIHRVLISFIRKRPRDLIKLCTLAAKQARKRGSIQIETEDFQKIFNKYSRSRLTDTVTEYRTELPEVLNLLLSLKPSVKTARKYSEKYLYTTEQVLAKISTHKPEGGYIFAKSSTQATDKELLGFLYRINFLTARRSGSDSNVRLYYEECDYLTDSDVDFSFKWEVHPAFRWALEPDDEGIIWDKLENLDT